MSSLTELPTDGFHHRVVIRKAAEKFNVSVKDGINHLVQNKIISNDSPVEVARVFHSVQGLSKRKIGEFLGKPADYNQKVLSVWLSGLELAGLDIDQGIRRMILKMRLPGEAQQIDRMIEKFAGEYVAQNPDFDGTVDLVYVLSFSIIMLNTDLHNPSIPRKMSCPDFIYNNRGINNGTDIPQEVLTRIYQRIKAQPIRMDEDDMFESEVSTFVAPLKSGWLWKRTGGQISSYKKYWFVVTDGCLYYFVTRQDRSPRAIIPLEQCRVAASRSRADLIILSRDDGLPLKTMKTTKMAQAGMKLSQHRQLIFRTSPPERSEWVASFQEAIRSLLSDELDLVDGLVAKQGVEVYQDPATGESIQYSEVGSPNTASSHPDTDLSRERAPTILMMKEHSDSHNNEKSSFNSEDSNEGVYANRRSLSQSKSTSRNYDSDSDAGDEQVVTSHAQYLSRPSSTGRGGKQLGEAHLLQGRVSVSRARGHGDTELILLNRISQIVSSLARPPQGAEVPPGTAESLNALLAVCAHVKESLASSSAVPPLSRGLNNHSDAVDTSIVVNQPTIHTADKLAFKGSAETVRWMKGVDRLLKKYDKQRSYNIEVLMKLQALERSVYVVCRICTDGVASMEGGEAMCEVYGDREVGMLETVDGDWKSYRFDKVWGIDVPQSQVYKDVEVLLSSVVDGYCACLIGVGDNETARRSASVFGDSNADLELGLAFHSASALWNNVQQVDNLGSISVFMGEVLSNGELVDLLSDVDGGLVDPSDADFGICLTKVQMKSTEQLKDIFKYALNRRANGNAVLCFDLSPSAGRLLVVDQGLEEETSKEMAPLTEDMGSVMQAVSAGVMQLGSFGGDAEPLRAVLGEQSVALAMYCVGNQESALAATSKYLLHSASMQNKLQTATGQTIVEGQVVQLHMRALKTRIASARQSVESLHADAERLLFEVKSFKEDKTIDVATLNALEEEVASARRAMDTQVSLLVSGLDQMTDYLREEASARDRHIVRLSVLEEEVKKLLEEGSDDPSSSRIGLVDSQTSLEGLLREMHVSIISKILTHNKKEMKGSFKERKQRLSLLEKKSSTKESHEKSTEVRRSATKNGGSKI